MPLKGGDRHGNYLTGYIRANQTFSIPLGAATRLQMGFYYRQSVLFFCFLKIRFTRRNHEIFPFGISDFGKLVGCFFFFVKKERLYPIVSTGDAFFSQRSHHARF